MKKLRLDDFKQTLLLTHLTESDHVRNIKELTEKFTTKRHSLDDYLSSEALVSSYAYFYLPTNVPKFHFVFQFLPMALQEMILSSPFIDMGSGPGTFLYALLLLKKMRGLSFDQDIYCIDKSALMLSQAKKIIDSHFENVSLKILSSYKEERSDAVLFFGHSLNEMGIEEGLGLIDKINPRVVFFIEPATKEFFNEIKKLRAALKEKYQIYYPCPSSDECPSSWCHQILRMGHEPCVERLSQLVSLDRKILPLVSHVYLRNDVLLEKRDEHEENEVVIHRFIRETKFSFDYEVCRKEEKNIIAPYVVLKKFQSKENLKKLKNLSVGEKVFFEGIKETKKKA